MGHGFCLLDTSGAVFQGAIAIVSRFTRKSCVLRKRLASTKYNGLSSIIRAAWRAGEGGWADGAATKASAAAAKLGAPQAGSGREGAAAVICICVCWAITAHAWPFVRKRI